MRILHVISSIDPRAGGTASAAMGLAQAQARIDENVTVLSTFGPEGRPETAAHLQKAGVAIRLVGPAHGPQLRHADLAAVVDGAVASSEIVHIHALWEQIQHLAARACQRLQRPYVISPHGMLDPWSLRQHRWRKRLYMILRMRGNLERAAAVHFTTQMEMKLAERLRLRSPTIVEPLGLDTQEFHDMPGPEVFRARFPAVGQRPIVLFLGRLHSKKGLDLLIPAFAQATPADAMLVIAGPDTDGYRETVEAMLNCRGLRERAFFTGMLHGRERIEALAAADLFVLPSYQENFGIAVIEAGAAGVPVVISDQVNIHDQVTSNALGSVVPTQVAPLAEQLTRWLSDSDLRRRTAKHCREFVLAHYDWLSIAQRWRAHYQGLIQ